MGWYKQDENILPFADIAMSQKPSEQHIAQHFISLNALHNVL